MSLSGQALQLWNGQKLIVMKTTISYVKNYDKLNGACPDSLQPQKPTETAEFPTGTFSRIGNTEIDLLTSTRYY
ncbi:MAG: hypothetical protein GY865_19065 [candidate division Zixibacteria bacterium]|nr:hypothetical protein [candidate division Zixibacteria bacterium]